MKENKIKFLYYLCSFMLCVCAGISAAALVSLQVFIGFLMFCALGLLFSIKADIRVKIILRNIIGIIMLIGLPVFFWKFDPSQHVLPPLISLFLLILVASCFIVESSFTLSLIHFEAIFIIIFSACLPYVIEMRYQVLIFCSALFLIITLLQITHMKLGDKHQEQHNLITNISLSKRFILSFLICICVVGLGCLVFFIVPKYAFEIDLAARGSSFVDFKLYPKSDLRLMLPYKGGEKQIEAGRVVPYVRSLFLKNEKDNDLINIDEEKWKQPLVIKRSKQKESIESTEINDQKKGLLSESQDVLKDDSTETGLVQSKDSKVENQLQKRIKDLSKFISKQKKMYDLFQFLSSDDPVKGEQANAIAAKIKQNQQKLAKLKQQLDQQQKADKKAYLGQKTGSSKKGFSDSLAKGFGLGEQIVEKDRLGKSDSQTQNKEDFPGEQGSEQGDEGTEQGNQSRQDGQVESRQGDGQGKQGTGKSSEDQGTGKGQGKGEQGKGDGQQGKGYGQGDGETGLGRGKKGQTPGESDSKGNQEQGQKQKGDSKGDDLGSKRGEGFQKAKQQKQNYGRPDKPSDQGEAGIEDRGADVDDSAQGKAQEGKDKPQAGQQGKDQGQSAFGGTNENSGQPDGSSPYFGENTESGSGDSHGGSSGGTEPSYKESKDNEDPSKPGGRSWEVGDKSEDDSKNKTNQPGNQGSQSNKGKQNFSPQGGSTGGMGSAQGAGEGGDKMDDKGESGQDEEEKDSASQDRKARHTVFTKYLFKFKEMRFDPFRQWPWQSQKPGIEKENAHEQSTTKSRRKPKVAFGDKKNSPENQEENEQDQSKHLNIAKVKKKKAEIRSEEEPVPEQKAGNGYFTFFWNLFMFFAVIFCGGIFCAVLYLTFCFFRKIFRDIKLRYLLRFNINKMIIYLYRNILFIFKSLGLKSYKHMSPGEIAKLASEKLSLSEDAVSALTEVFEKSRYSQHELDKNNIKTCINSYNELKIDIINKHPWFKRLMLKLEFLSIKKRS
jgi:hypothetical protein